MKNLKLSITDAIQACIVDKENNGRAVSNVMFAYVQQVEEYEEYLDSLSQESCNPFASFITDVSQY